MSTYPALLLLIVGTCSQPRVRKHREHAPDLPAVSRVLEDSPNAFYIVQIAFNQGDTVRMLMLSFKQRARRPRCSIAGKSQNVILQVGRDISGGTRAQECLD